MYKVTVKPEIANLRANNTGTRRVRAWAGTKREEVLTFSVNPVELAELPPEVEADDMLVIERPGKAKLVDAKTPEPVAAPRKKK